MKRKRLLKPTHHLVKDGTVYALVRLHFGVRVKLTSTGAVQDSVGTTIESDMRDGRWRAPLHFLFGEEAAHIPIDAELVELGRK